MQDQVGDDGKYHHIFAASRVDSLDIGEIGHMGRKRLPRVSTAFRTRNANQRG